MKIEDARKMIAVKKAAHYLVGVTGIGRTVKPGSELAVEDGCSCGADFPCDVPLLADIAERALEVVEAARLAADELATAATEIRMDWSGFDGRDNLRNVKASLAPVAAALTRFDALEIGK